MKKQILKIGGSHPTTEVAGFPAASIKKNNNIQKTYRNGAFL